MNRIYLLFTIIVMATSCNTVNKKTHKNDLKNNANHLVNESSPYLLQHAYNPVDWHPWGEKALKEAKENNKLLIVSVGYAACHWCHVMEHESFEDSLVAEVMNNHFVPIKVDREERPDIDDIYMTACNLYTGKGGWPLNAIALPDGRPIWAGTYFPKENWLKILNQFVELKTNNYDQLVEAANKLTAGIQETDKIITTNDDYEFKKESIDFFKNNILKVSDLKNGGRKGAPKFPMPSIYELLLKQYKISPSPEVKEAIDITLQKMADGGIYDHVGGGFSRYSVDDIWLVPHFEKMLYDNSQLVSLYSKAYKLTKDAKYLDVINNTLQFVDEELTDKSGIFYSSLDADSEGEEGKFYIWSEDEVKQLLGDSFELFAYVYDVTKDGNWEHSNIINRVQSNQEAAKKFNLSEAEVHDQLKSSLKLLKETRSKREKPALDDKSIMAWNALMITGYIDAYKATKNEDYKRKALKAIQFVNQSIMQSDGRLDRNYKNGKTSINAFLDDYAFYILALIDAYEITFDTKYLNTANKLASYTIEHFKDNETGMFFYKSNIDPPLVAKKKELGDNVIPGSNSAIARALHELGTLLYNKEYTKTSKLMLTKMSEQLTKSDRTDFLSSWAQLYLDMVYPVYEVAIVGDNADELRNEMMTHFNPNVLLIGGKDEGNLELLKGKLSEGETMIYVCQNRVCKFPVRDVKKALQLMK